MPFGAAIPRIVVAPNESLERTREGGLELHPPGNRSLSMPSSASKYGFVGLVAALLLGQGLYWFIGGSAADHSSTRNAFAIAQIVLAAAVLIWAQLKIWRAKSTV